jgi:hypothetical protein
VNPGGTRWKWKPMADYAAETLDQLNSFQHLGEARSVTKRAGGLREVFAGVHAHFLDCVVHNGVSRAAWRPSCSHSSRFHSLALLAICVLPSLPLVFAYMFDIIAFIHSPRSVRIAGFLFNSTPAPDHHHQSLLNPFYLSPYQIDACQLSSTKGPSISQHGSLGPAAF